MLSPLQIFPPGQIDASRLTAGAISLGANRIRPAPLLSPLHVNPCDGGADAAWDNQTWQVTRALDTVNCQCFKTTHQGIKVTNDGANTNGHVKETFAADLDVLSAFAFAIRYYVHEGVPGVTYYDKLSQIHLHVIDLSTDDDHWIVLYKQAGRTDFVNIGPGWHEVVMTRTGMVTPGTINEWDHIIAMTFRQYATGATHTPSVTLDSVVALPKLATPRAVMCWDDGYDDAYTIAKQLNAYGLKGTFAIIPSLIGTTGKLTWAECREMQAWGHLIVNHTNVITNWVDMTTDQKITGIRDAQSIMADQGLARGARIVVTPGGGYDVQADDENILDIHCDLVRSTRQPSSFDGKALWYPWQRSQRVIHSGFSDDLSSDGLRDELEDQFDNAIADGAVIVSVMHDMNAAALTRLHHVLADLKVHTDAGNIVSSTLEDLAQAT